jgi:hypothetical protein
MAEPSQLGKCILAKFCDLFVFAFGKLFGVTDEVSQAGLT